MERIQEAVNKAKRDRNNNHSVSNNSVKNGTISSITENREWDNCKRNYVQNSHAQDSHHDSSPYKNYEDAVSIKYSQTRVVTLTNDELKARNIVAGLTHDDRSEPYRQLRTQLLKKMREDNLRTLAITSPNEGNGKTLTAINLAISLAKEVNQTVMLVDLDLRHPSIA